MHLPSVLAVASLLLMAPHAAPVVLPDRSTPTGAVEAFFAAFERKDVAALRLCVPNAVPNPRTDQALAGDGIGLKAVRIRIVEKMVEADTALVAATYRWTSRAASAEATENLLLSRTADGWKIAGGDQFLGVVASIAAGNGAALSAFESARAKARSASCLSNGKQLVLASLMYSQDYDEVFPPKAWVPALLPYFRNAAVLTCPLDAPGTLSYTLNTAVAGQGFTRLIAPAETVVMYEGKGGVLDFRHDGRAMVGFADGHCKMVDVKEARGLYWTFEGPKPKPKATPARGPKASGKAGGRRP